MTKNSGRIQYLSPAAPVSMADQWFGIASLDHFWCRRRLEVFKRLAAGFLTEARYMAEVGCGNGIVQRQIEDAFHKPITGFDLNDVALGSNLSQLSDVCCYNVFQQNPDFKQHFDCVVLFDVLEHLDDEDGFLQAVQFHMAPEGKLMINVPALQQFYSSYDEAVGHIRRYNIATLSEVAKRNGMVITGWTYWGLPLMPLLIIRKLLPVKKSKEQTISCGMDSRGPFVNRLLLALSRLEFIPQHLVGTSLMAVLEKAPSQR